MDFQTVIPAGLAICVAGTLLCFFIDHRFRSKSSDRIRCLEKTQGELNTALMEAKLERSQAVRTAEQIPVIVQKLTERLSADSYPPIVVRHAKEILNAARVGYFVPVPDSEHFALKVGYGFPGEWEDTFRIAQDEGAVGQAIRKRVVLTKEEIESGGNRTPQSSLEREGIHPDLVAPVFGISGIEGILVLEGCNGCPVNRKTHVSMLADLLSLSIQNATLLETNDRGVYHDPLTGLANRFYFARVFESEIRRALNYQQPLSLLFFDLDRFKEINETLGHRAGDEVLRNVARITRSCTRSSHIIARYGADEFVVLLPSTDKEPAYRYAENLRKRIAEAEIAVEGSDDPVRLTISGGISTFPGDGRSTTELARNADEALDEAKKEGKNRIARFHPGEETPGSGIPGIRDDEEGSAFLEEKTGSG